MSILDTTIVNVALDTLGRDLHSPLASIQWVLTGYMLALAAVIPVTGWAARRFGAGNVYLVSLVLFTAGSALCGARDLDRPADRLPHPAGPRRRDAAADRAADARERGRPEADGPRDERRRDPGDARADLRPDDRRPHRRQPELALDLLRQHPDRDRRVRRRLADPAARNRGRRPRSSTCPASCCWPRASRS